MSVFVITALTTFVFIHNIFAFDPRDSCNDVDEEVWNYVPCDQYYEPDYCFNNKKAVETLDDFDRCGPSHMSITSRNYFLGASGRRETYKDNKRAIRKIKLIPKALRDVSESNMKINIMGMDIDFPIGISPVGIQKLAHPDGELGMVSGLSSFKTIMILSSYATTSIEEVAERAKGSSLHLWMQTYFFKNRTSTLDIVHKAERNGFKALVVTADANINAMQTCGGRTDVVLPPGVEIVNVGKNFQKAVAENATFDSIKWLKLQTKLPIVAKGIFTGSDAMKAIEAGATAILVSNHGGRQVDGSPATIDALPFVVDQVKAKYPHVEIYMDGGIRNGYDVYKALARGAKMVFLGRPSVWGLAINGSSGVHKMMNIIQSEFLETMTLMGNTHPSQITRDSLLPQLPTFH